MTKRLLIAALLTAVGICGMAQDYKYLTAAYNGVERSFELATVRKITFESDNVAVNTSQGVTSLPLDGMERMFFSAEATAVASPKSEGVSLTMDGSLLRARGKGYICIYNTAGQLVSMAHADGDTAVSLSSLPKGVYILRLGDETIKITKQ